MRTGGDEGETLVREQSRTLTLAHQRGGVDQADVSIVLLDSKNFQRWNDFVLDCPDAGFFHRAEWKTVIENAFALPTHFLYAEAGGRIEGVLPLAEMRGWVFGYALVSLPYGVHAGIAAITERARLALDCAARKLAARLGVDYLEYRNRRRQHPDWPCDTSYSLFKTSLVHNAGRDLMTIPAKRRSMVRKASRAGLASALDCGIDDFFGAYSDSMQRLGTPVFPKRYFAALKAEFGNDCEILTVRKDTRIVAAAMSFVFRDETTPYYAGGTFEARALAGNDFMYWELVRRAAERGIRVFNAGRSRVGSGSADFKELWGFVPETLYYEYHVLRGRPPLRDPNDARYRLLVTCWKRLPLAVANRLGPVLSRNLG